MVEKLIFRWLGVLLCLSLKKMIVLLEVLISKGRMMADSREASPTETAEAINPTDQTSKAGTHSETPTHKVLLKVRHG